MNEKRIIMVLGIGAALSLIVMVAVGYTLLTGAPQAISAAERADAEAALEAKRARQEAFATLDIASFALVDQQGKAVTNAILDGEYTVVSFMFSNCPFACPIMNGNMYRVATEGPKGLRIVSFSVDPENDTPEALAQYAKNLGVGAPKWRMLTGPFDVIENVADSLGFDIRPDPSQLIDLPSGGQMANIIHPVRFILLGPDRKIIDMYKGDTTEDVDRLLLDLRTLPISDE